MVFELAGKSIAEICRPPQINKIHRSQSVKTALSGRLLIDRIGRHKFEIVAEIPFIVDTVWYEIIEDLEQLSFPVRFDFEGETLTREFHLKGNIPSPIILNSDNQSYFRNIALTLEEL